MALAEVLHPRDILRATEDTVIAERQAAVDQLKLALAWADLHLDDPRDEPHPHSLVQGDRLVQLGGDGTPRVRDLCWAEFAVARHAGEVATRHLGADALDLAWRLPNTWAAVCDLVLPAWVGRKVAAATRQLTREQALLVDTAVAAAATQAPGRILALLEAKVIEADLDAHRARVAVEERKVGVHLSRPRIGEEHPGVRRIAMKLHPGTAVDFDATVDQLAHKLADTEPDNPLTHDQWRAEAVRLLADPHAAAAFLDQTDVPARPRKPATIYVHLSAAALAGVPAVARVEGLGPVLLDRLAELLGRRDIHLAPVIDLAQTRTSSAYEHPATMKTRTLLRTGGDVFPHSSQITGRVDHDHATPWPRGQTTDLNDAPLTRRHHRAKTHLNYTLRQLGLGVYRWTTPHGLGRIVTPAGTKDFEPLGTTGEIYRSNVRPVRHPGYISGSGARESPGLGQPTNTATGRAGPSPADS